MNALPRAARWYLFGVWGMATVLVTGALARPADLPQPLLLLAVLVAFIMADCMMVEYVTDEGKQIGMTITDALVIFLAGTAGTYGLLVIVAGSLITDVIGKRGWIKGVFNAAQRAIIFVAVLTIFYALHTPGAPPFSGSRGLLAFVLMAVTHTVLNTLLVATIVALAGRHRLIEVYLDSFHSVNWVHFITLPFGAIMAYIWATNPWLLLPAAFPLVMAQRSFQALAQSQEQNRNNQELAQRATLLLEELQMKQEELLRSSKLAALGTLSAGIGHEFNNLLTAIEGNAQLGLATDSVDEKDESLEVVLQASLRGRSITSGMLNFARRSEPKRAPHDLSVIVREAVALVQPEFVRHSITVEQRLEAVPPIVCDSGQITQVLINLLTNARDALADNGGGRIVIELHPYESFVNLAVSDTGRGIPETLLPHIFQPFVTSKAQIGSGNSGGTGLGLAISYGIVESHGGTIEVHSTVGCGTTMTISLPIADPDAYPRPARVERPEPPVRVKNVG